MAQQEPSTEQIVQAVYGYAAELIKKGLSGPQVENELVESGLDQQIASVVVNNLLARSRARREAGRKNMRYGALWCIGGIIVTVATYAAASGGGTYIIAWGAIIFGAIQFLRGLSQYSD